MRLAQNMLLDAQNMLLDAERAAEQDTEEQAAQATKQAAKQTAEQAAQLAQLVVAHVAQLEVVEDKQVAACRELELLKPAMLELEHVVRTQKYTIDRLVEENYSSWVSSDKWNMGAAAEMKEWLDRVRAPPQPQSHPCTCSPSSLTPPPYVFAVQGRAIEHKTTAHPGASGDKHHEAGRGDGSSGGERSAYPVATRGDIRPRFPGCKWSDKPKVHASHPIPQPTPSHAPTG